jgi:sterol desaturase/sphingolipid hydroxylase (fatty acid hydroxylase superfamily)
MMWVSLEQGKVAYWADILLYLGAVLLLTTLLVARAPPQRQLSLLLVVAAGLLCWTLLEYLLHRIVLHALPPFKRWHAMHHRRPAALIGTPILLSAPLFATLFFLLPLWLGDIWLACALSLGVLAGYSVYSLTHHAIHHGRSRSPLLLRLQRRHARHHQDAVGGNYGVTSGVWDAIFGSSLPPRVRQHAASAVSTPASSTVTRQEAQQVLEGKPR